MSGVVFGVIRVASRNDSAGAAYLWSIEVMDLYERSPYPIRTPHRHRRPLYQRRRNSVLARMSSKGVLFAPFAAQLVKER